MDTAPPSGLVCAWDLLMMMNFTKKTPIIFHMININRVFCPFVFTAQKEHSAEEDRLNEAQKR